MVGGEGMRYVQYITHSTYCSCCSKERWLRLVGDEVGEKKRTVDTVNSALDRPEYSRNCGMASPDRDCLWREWSRDRPRLWAGLVALLNIVHLLDRLGSVIWSGLDIV